jgi:secreted PhoX family phosphatase
MVLTRRDLLRNSAMTGATLAAGSLFSGLALGGTAAAGPKGYGPLLPDPNGILDLPEGFRYEVLARGGNGYLSAFTTYDDGQKLAGDADGAASFAIGGNRTAIVLNHELSNTELAERVPTTFGGRDVPTYDAGAGGGTSTIVLTPRNQVVSVVPSLAGTFNNCAGGPTPWGTWLTCEETQTTLAKPHGYIFEVDPMGALTTAVPYLPMGRFAHEAVAIDPDTSFAFMTEDNNNGLLYRYEPTDTSQSYGSLGNGGVVKAMKAQGLLRLGEVRTVGRTIAIGWVAIPDGGSPDRLNLNQAWTNDQVTRSRKLEGIWYGDGKVYFTSADESIPGVDHQGQVWMLDPAADTITLVAHIPTGHPQFDRPDNITVTPWGQLLLCEDGDGEQYLVGCEPATGELWAFARNALSGNEFCGANFSPDGKTLFVSIQNPSTTFAITGPWGATRTELTS